METKIFPSVTLSEVRSTVPEFVLIDQEVSVGLLSYCTSSRTKVPVPARVFPQPTGGLDDNAQMFVLIQSATPLIREYTPGTPERAHPTP